jgi:hypothetical protein
MARAGLLIAGCLGGLATTQYEPMALVLLFGFGVGWCILFTTQQTALQMLTPDAVRARVMSINVLAWGAAPLGHLFFGWLGKPEQLDVAGAFWVLAVGALAVASFTALSIVPAIEGSALAEAEPLLVET